MRGFAYVLTLLGLFFLGDAAYDQYRGVASVREGGRSGLRRLKSVARADNPEEFRHLMTYQWVRGPLCLGAAFVFLAVLRRADRTDPLSPHYAGSKDLEDWSRKLAEEESQRDRPPK